MKTFEVVAEMKFELDNIKEGVIKCEAEARLFVKADNLRSAIDHAEGYLKNGYEIKRIWETKAPSEKEIPF